MRGRWVRITLVVSVLVISVNIGQAIADTEAFTGATYIWIGFIVAVTGDHPQPDLPAPGGRPRDDPRCDLLVPPASGSRSRRSTGCCRASAPSNSSRSPARTSAIDFLYFSFVVLTTTGFGDLTPGTSVGKVIVTIEALIGQVFLVTIVASLVSSFVGIRRPRPEVDTGSEEDRGEG